MFLLHTTLSIDGMWTLPLRTLSSIHCCTLICIKDTLPHNIVKEKTSLRKC